MINDRPLGDLLRVQRISDIGKLKISARVGLADVQEVSLLIGEALQQGRLAAGVEKLIPLPYRTDARTGGHSLELKNSPAPLESIWLCLPGTRQPLPASIQSAVELV